MKNNPVSRDSLVKDILLVERSTCGQSYKQFKLVNYYYRVIVTSKLLIFMTLDW